MKKNIQLDINHIVSHESTHLQRVELLKQILFEDMTDKEAINVLKEVLKDYKQSEQEFENRTEVMLALDILIDGL